jgi:hypothetical protein
MLAQSRSARCGAVHFLSGAWEEVALKSWFSPGPGHQSSTACLCVAADERALLQYFLSCGTLHKLRELRMRELWCCPCHGRHTLNCPTRLAKLTAASKILIQIGLTIHLILKFVSGSAS